MSGPGTSMGIGAASAVGMATFGDIIGPEAILIALAGGAGGLSRWLFLFLNGVKESWQRAVAAVILGIMFVAGTAPIAIPMFAALLGDVDIAVIQQLRENPNSAYGLAYMSGVFSISIIGLLMDKLDRRADSKRGGVVDE